MLAPREIPDPPLVAAENSIIKCIENQETELFVLRSHFLNFFATTGEGNDFTHVCLSTGAGVGALQWSVCFLLECILVIKYQRN